MTSEDHCVVALGDFLKAKFPTATVALLPLERTAAIFEVSEVSEPFFIEITDAALAILAQKQFPCSDQLKLIDEQTNLFTNASRVAGHVRVDASVVNLLP